LRRANKRLPLQALRALRWGATLTGVKLFSAKGYVACDLLKFLWENGEALPIVHMEKRVAGNRNRMMARRQESQPKRTRFSCVAGYCTGNDFTARDLAV